MTQKTVRMLVVLILVFAFSVVEAGAVSADSSYNVEIDIKPGRFPNRIELTKNICNNDDNLYVAILTTPKFDARTVDVSTLQLGDPNLAGRVSPVKDRITNVDGDKDKDLALTFTLCSIVTAGAIDGDSTELALTGSTMDGTSITGRDSVRVVGRYIPVRPIFDYPVDGQTLDYEGSYLFRVHPIPAAEGFLWGFFQNGVMVWENYRDEGVLSGNEYGIHPGTIAHSQFALGEVEVWVRASINGQWTDATVITIYLQPRTP